MSNCTFKCFKSGYKFKRILSRDIFYSALSTRPRGHPDFRFSLCPLWKINILLQFLLSLLFSLPSSLSPALLLFSPVPRGGQRRGKAPLPTLYCPNVISSHSSVPASTLRGEAGCRCEGGDESAVIDKLNYRQSQIPPGPFSLGYREISSAILPVLIKFSQDVSWNISALKRTKEITFYSRDCARQIVPPWKWTEFLL